MSSLQNLKDQRAQSSVHLRFATLVLHYHSHHPSMILSIKAVSTMPRACCKQAFFMPCVSFHLHCLQWCLLGTGWCIRCPPTAAWRLWSCARQVTILVGTGSPARPAVSTSPHATTGPAPTTAVSELFVCYGPFCLQVFSLLASTSSGFTRALLFSPEQFVCICDIIQYNNLIVIVTVVAAATQVQVTRFSL
jgi:hypothetical protein